MQLKMVQEKEKGIESKPPFNNIILPLNPCLREIDYFYMIFYRKINLKIF